ncbi:outer membrane efflux protein BepC precursor [Mariprofundus micogutta]|uniref:Outer membrane efflux protein BepC n=1 Tax=Mariprofundus micogutta TaxID=1921010 RepID=A0A1L8CP79_9PROT|nr:TolC family protein [Mariprofundus micogutta]GAV20731.1 outer membrane efflux protein BepC precursor [Mariprofundus micogutta]
MAFFSPKTSANYAIINKLMVPLTVALFALPATAAEISSLKQSVEYALQHNRLLAADAQTLEQAQARQDGAFGRLMPRLDVSTGVARTDAPGSYLGMKLNQKNMSAADFNPAFINNPGYINNYQTRVGLSLPVYQGGALWAGKRLAGHQAESSRFAHEAARQQVIYQVIEAYARTRQTFSQIEVMERAVSAANKRHQDTQAMQKRGVLIDSDVMDARVHLLRTDLQLQQAKNAHARSLDALQRVMGINGEVSMHANEEPRLKAVELTLAGAVETAHQTRLDLKAMQQGYEAADAGVDKAQSGFLPHVNLVAASEWNSSTLALKNRNTMIGATVSMNLFAGGSDMAQVRVARAELVSLEYKIADRKQQIKNEVSHAWRMLEEAKLRYQSETEAMKQSVESLRIKSLRFEQGLSTTTDLLDAQLQADSSRVSAIRARYDVIISQAGLLMAVGSLNEEIIQ